MLTIPFANPGARVAKRKQEYLAAVERVFDSGQYILGHEVDAFEREFAEAVGAKYCVGVANGTDAVTLALLATRGCLRTPVDREEVITVSLTAVGTVLGICRADMTPVLVDVDMASRTMCPLALEEAITDKTTAIVPVHLYGQPVSAYIFELAKRYDLRVVEDCAQAFGATLGRWMVGSSGGFGDAAAFSFYPTKNLGAVGDGGAVVTNDQRVATQLRRLRQYGWDDSRSSVTRLGRNSRLDEVQAALLRVDLKYAFDDVARRRQIACRYDEVQTSLVMPHRVPGSESSYHLYVATSDMRTQAVRQLRERGIDVGCHYPLAVHQQPLFGAWAGRALPSTSRLSASVISLPMYPELTDDEVEHVCKSLSEVSC